MSYGPPHRRLPAFLVAAAVCAGGAVFIPELWALVAVLLAAAGRDWWYRPALELSPEGFHYVDGLQKRFAAWNLVTAIRVRQERHLLVFATNLEIDLSDETLILLSRGQLGAEPDAVADAVESAWQQAVSS